MDYEGQICRAPMERSSFMLPVMVGCSYNSCKFCNLFRHLSYRVLPLAQIENELKRVKDLGGSPEKVFLGDGNAFNLETDRLIEILEMIGSYFPSCSSINMDAAISSIRSKTDKELEMLYTYGVRHLYIGIESGLDDVLAFMNKEHTVKEAYNEIARIKAAGMIFDAHIMTGSAGRGRGEESAAAMAAFLNETRPGNVVNFSMFLHEEVPLFEDITSGAFFPADELESLKEERSLIIDLQSGKNRTIYYDGFHDYIEMHIHGKLPENKEKMLEKLEKSIREYENLPPVYAYVYGECPQLKKRDGSHRVWNME